MELAGGESSGDPQRQIRVRFVTQLPRPLKVSVASIAVPSNLSRLGLSEIVNLLLQNANSDHESQPFDFLVDGEFVRMPLDDLLLAKGISAERVLEIEYVKAVAPKRQLDPIPHNDWVSAADGSNTSFILTGCYDGVARIWNDQAICTHLLEGHSDGITSAKIITNKENDDSIHVATGSKDRSLRLWKFYGAEITGQAKRVGPYKILQGHSASVQCFAVNPSRMMICSGSWDCSIKLWDINASEVDGDTVALKKRRLGIDLSGSQDSQLEVESLTMFLGHTQCVSAVIWPDVQTLYSASWDHSIRQWDIQTGKENWNLSCGKALNCMDCGGEGLALLAAGGSDPVLRIWDPRKPGSLAPAFQFWSHSSWITSCKWHPRSRFHLLSASFDGKVMLWDLRTALPLAIIDSHQDKVLCADWWKENSLISGGADSMLRIASGIVI